MPCATTSKNSPPGSAERQAQPDLVGAAAHHKRGHAIDADRGENQRDRRKEPEQPPFEAPIGNRAGDEVTHAANVVHGAVATEPTPGVGPTS